MIVPGGNLLNLALSVIQPQAVKWYVYTGKGTNAEMMPVSIFAPPVDIVGSLQPVSVERKTMMGLSLGTSYAMLYATGAHAVLTRDNASDQFGYAGRRYEITDRTNWSAQDGWDGCLLTDIGPDA